MRKYIAFALIFTLSCGHEKNQVEKEVLADQIDCQSEPDYEKAKEL